MDLGVTIDNKLKFSNHVNRVAAKAKQVLGCVRHTFKYLTAEVFLLLYKSLLRPHLEYASCVWSPHLKRDADAVERVQRRATKIVEGFSNMSYQERLETLKLPTLKFRRQRTDVIQVYKIVHSLDKISLDTKCVKCPGKEMLLSSLTKRTRGHSLKLQMQEATGARGRFFATRVIQNWNELSETTVQAHNVNLFKNRLQQDWANHPDMYEYTFSY